MAEANPDITKRVLHNQLKQLELYQIVSRSTYDEVPLRIKYFLTEEGEKVFALLNDINDWGLEFTPKFKEIYRP